MLCSEDASLRRGHLNKNRKEMMLCANLGKSMPGRGNACAMVLRQNCANIFTQSSFPSFYMESQIGPASFSRSHRGTCGVGNESHFWKTSGWRGLGQAVCRDSNGNIGEVDLSPVQHQFEAVDGNRNYSPACLPPPWQ